MIKSNISFCIRSSYSCEPIPSSPICSLKRDDVRVKVVDGNCVYEKVGEINTNEYINSFKDGCSLKALLQRCSLMPTERKISYLQQSSDGFSVDLSSMPNNGTDAFIMLNKLKESNPEIFTRFSNGESFDSIIKSFVPSDSSNSENIDNKGDVNNG